MSKRTSSKKSHGAGGGKPPILTNSLFSMRRFDATKDLPLVYSSNYNMSMVGVELLHDFDTQKYGKIANQLDSLFLDTPFARHIHYDEHNDGQENPAQPRRLRFLEPNRPVTEQELSLHHSSSYITRIHTNKSLLARITETWLLNLIPQSVLHSRVLEPIKWQISGTIYAVHLAMQHGWAINLGGGFHQARANSGETFCIFSDVLLAIKWVWRKHPLQKFMIIDLDAHEAVGIAQDLLELEPKRRAQVFLVDVFNNTIQPPDSRGNSRADVSVELARFTGDTTYMRKVSEALERAFAVFKPSMVIYIAGQDILKDDQLGLMNISDEVLKKRDELVFSWATEKMKCSIVMLLGGGYLIRSTGVLADSIRSLFARGLIWAGFRDGNRTLSRPRPGALDTASQSTRSSSSGHSKSSKGARQVHRKQQQRADRKQPDGAGTHGHQVIPAKASSTPLDRASATRSHAEQPKSVAQASPERKPPQ